MNNTLTSEQEYLMSIIRDKWIKILFDTSPVDKDKAETAINLTYESMEENNPSKIVWFSNPLEAVVWMIDNLAYLKQLEDVPGKSYKLAKSSSIANHIIWEDELIASVDREIDPYITQKFYENFSSVIHPKYLHWLSNSFLANFLNCHLRFHLVDLWGEEKYLSKRGDYHDIETTQVIAMHDTYYLALSSFYHAIGCDRSEYRGYWQAARYCGLWWAFADVAVVVPKPSEINLDSEYRLHAEEKPAIVYNNFESYANHEKFINS